MYQPAFSEYNIVMSRLCSFGLAVLQFREVYTVPHNLHSTSLNLAGWWVRIVWWSMS